MTQEIYNQRIVAYDHDNMGILCVVPSDEIGSVLCMGFLNSKWISVSRFWDYQERLKAINFDDISINHQIKFSEKGTTIIPMLDKLVTDEWKEKRKLALEKRKCLTSWEWLCRDAVSKSNDFYGWPQLLPFLIRELNKCNIQENFYPTSILEWAEIHEITPEAAVNELEMKVHGIGCTYMRNYAFYDKYARLITMSNTIEEVNENFQIALFNRRRPLD
jgi:hypothetical protein